MEYRTCDRFGRHNVDIVSTLLTCVYELCVCGSMGVAGAYRKGSELRQRFLDVCRFTSEQCSVHKPSPAAKDKEWQSHKRNVFRFGRRSALGASVDVTD